MIFQMVRQILDSLIQMIISRVISSTINNMCDSILLQLLKVSGDIVRAQVQKIIEDWRANFVEKGVLILLS
jgi:protein involved in temperature-dependent protein secretion